MMRIALLVGALAAALQVLPADGARILAVFPFPSPSHLHVLNALTKALAARGHQLVVVSPYPQKTPIANYTDIDLMPVMMKDQEKLVGSLFDIRKASILETMQKVFGIALSTTETALTSPQMKNILNDKQGFDMVITELFQNEAANGLAHYFKAPLVLVCPFGGFHWHNYGVSNPVPLSYVPVTILGYTHKMTFPERLHNVLIAWAWDAGRYLYYLPRQEEIAKKVFGDGIPNIHELEALPSLVLINQHFTLNYPRPLLPNFIEVGGMHVSREIKPLEKEFNDFIDGAKNGVIYFSMGSNLRSDQMGPAKIHAFVKAFSALPQRVIWKWDADLFTGEKPKNIKIAKWMPQQEILAHPNVRVFITHGGLLSAQEAAYHGKVLIGIPIFGDQQMNMNRACSGGYGVLLDFDNITIASVTWAINEAFTNQRIIDASQQRSLQYRDQPDNPLDKAVFWTEYVLRHKGAMHMKSAGSDLRWFQLCLLDVYAAIFTPILLLVWLCLRCCCRRSGSSPTKFRNQNKDNKKNK